MGGNGLKLELTPPELFALFRSWTGSAASNIIRCLNSDVTDSFACAIGHIGIPANVVNV